MIDFLCTMCEDDYAEAYNCVAAVGSQGEGTCYCVEVAFGVTGCVEAKPPSQEVPSQCNYSDPFAQITCLKAEEEAEFCSLNPSDERCFCYLYSSGESCQ